MSDERFEQDLKLVLREIAGEPSMSLRYRIAETTAQAPIGRRGWFSPPIRLATATVGAVAVLALAFSLVPHQGVGPPVTAGPSPSGSSLSPEPSPSATPGTSPSTPAPSADAPTTPAPTIEPSAEPTTPPTPKPTIRPGPVSPPWTSLTWTHPVVPFPYQPPVDAGQLGATVTINDVTGWNGGFVGVGTIDGDGSCVEAGFFHSTDGLRWDLVQRVSSGEDRTPMMCPQFVARLGHGLIALGQARVWRSTDGAGWTELDSASLRSVWTSPAPELVAVAAGPRGIVAIGQPANTFDSVVAFSPDGQRWTPIALPARKTAIAWDVALGSSGFVIVGRDGQADSAGINTTAGVGSPAAWYSADGATWTEAHVPGASVRGGVLTRVLAGAGGLFAVGNDVGITHYEDLDARRIGAWTSPDGRSWQKAGSLESLVHGTALLASDGTSIVALGNDTGLSISTDGRDWSPVTETGDLQVPSSFIGPLTVREASPTYGYDFRLWVGKGGLIGSYAVDSPEGFAVKALQLGTAVTP